MFCVKRLSARRFILDNGSLPPENFQMAELKWQILMRNTPTWLGLYLSVLRAQALLKRMRFSLPAHDFKKVMGRHQSIDRMADRCGERKMNRLVDFRRKK
eukprot:scaffold3987_cov134-Cylindrotheca_fusiformis.AAC.6